MTHIKAVKQDFQDFVFPVTQLAAQGYHSHLYQGPSQLPELPALTIHKMVGTPDNISNYQLEMLL